MTRLPVGRLACTIARDSFVLVCSRACLDQHPHSEVAPPRRRRRPNAPRSFKHELAIVVCVCALHLVGPHTLWCIEAWQWQLAQRAAPTSPPSCFVSRPSRVAQTNERTNARERKKERKKMCALKVAYNQQILISDRARVRS